MRRLSAALLLVLPLVVVGTAGPAAARCPSAPAEDKLLADADVVFTGISTSEAADGVAAFRVRKYLKGGDPGAPTAVSVEVGDGEDALDPAVGETWKVFADRDGTSLRSEPCNSVRVAVAPVRTRPTVTTLDDTKGDDDAGERGHEDGGEDGEDGEHGEAPKPLSNTRLLLFLAAIAAAALLVVVPGFVRRAPTGHGH